MTTAFRELTEKVVFYNGNIQGLIPTVFCQYQLIGANLWILFQLSSVAMICDPSSSSELQRYFRVSQESCAVDSLSRRPPKEHGS